MKLKNNNCLYLLSNAKNSLNVINELLRDGQIDCHNQSIYNPTAKKVDNKFSAIEMYSTSLAGFILQRRNDLNLEENFTSSFYDELKVNDIIFDMDILGIVLPCKDLVENPYKFISFFDDKIYHALYTGYDEVYINDLIINSKLSGLDREERIEYIRKYIGDIRALMVNYRLNLPIYDSKYKKEIRLKLIK